MSFIRFGKKIEHRKFDYIPRYYDPDKEELEQRIKQYKTNPDNSSISKERIRSGLRKKYRRGQDDYSKRSQRRSNRILFITIFVLLFLSYIFISNYLPKIISSFGQ